jgi:methanogenic corrinoid protein MtbC1
VAARDEDSDLWTLEEIGRLVSASGNAAETLNNIVHLIRSRFDTDVCSVYLLEPDRTSLVLAATLGLARFLRERVDPILVEVGRAWARGDLQIRHEHFISEVVEDTLRGLRRSLGSPEGVRPVVLASMPGELHRLGLQIAGLVIAAAGRAEAILGGNTPVEEIVETAVALDAAAVGLSLSPYSASEGAVAAVADIRRRLPSRTRLWLGGSGARTLEGLPPNVQVLDTLDSLDRALRALGD